MAMKHRRNTEKRKHVKSSKNAVLEKNEEKHLREIRRSISLTGNCRSKRTKH